ncbi:MAG: fibronectin type III domain-containing protein [Bacteroidetes bacterium]|nr:fibronectin type III domain-containing protein [Bacteroidota bacterium]
MNQKHSLFQALKRLAFIVISLAMLHACKKDKSSSSFTVSGSIANIEATAPDVSVKISNAQRTYEGLAAKSGTFSIDNVVQGDYTLNISQEKSSGHVERNIKVSVNNGNLTLNLLLPDPVVLSSPSHTDRSITLAWTRSSDSGFREYKVYRGYSPGLDENTGALLNVFTEPGDTTCTDAAGMTNNDGLSPGTTYYYRVMVMDEYGKIAGSNLLGVTTDLNPPVPELYKLEEVTNFAGNGSIGRITGVTFDGNYLWIAYAFSSGGYYDSVTVTLVQYDYVNNQSLKSFTYKDVYPEFGGLESGGNYLWLQVTKPGNFHSLLKIDPSDGRILNSFSTNYGVRDLGYFNDKIYLNYYYNKIELINPLNGGLLQEITTHIPPGTNCHGMAVRAGEIWVSYFLVNPGFLYIIDENASLIGYVTTVFEDFQICFMNKQLVLNDQTRIHIYNIIGQP